MEYLSERRKREQDLLLPMKNTLALVLMVFGLVGCATAEFVRNLDSWVGTSIEEYFLVNSMPTDSVIELSNGSKIFNFKWSAVCFWNISTNSKDIITNVVMDSSCSGSYLVKMNPRFKPNQ